MDGAGFKARLKRLGRTQVGFARENGFALRTVHNWAAGGPPEEVGRLLELMERLEMPFGPDSDVAASSVFPASVERELRRLEVAAGADRREAFVRSVELWLARQKIEAAALDDQVSTAGARNMNI